MDTAVRRAAKFEVMQEAGTPLSTRMARGTSTVALLSTTAMAATPIYDKAGSGFRQKVHAEGGNLGKTPPLVLERSITHCLYN